MPRRVAAHVYGYGKSGDVGRRVIYMNRQSRTTAPEPRRAYIQRIDAPQAFRFQRRIARVGIWFA
jgi:hypothetical protein